MTIVVLCIITTMKDYKGLHHGKHIKLREYVGDCRGTAVM